MSYSQVKLGAIMTHRPDILESLQTSENQETSEAWLTITYRRRVCPGGCCWKAARLCAFSSDDGGSWRRLFSALVTHGWCLPPFPYDVIGTRGVLDFFWRRRFCSWLYSVAVAAAAAFPTTS